MTTHERLLALAARWEMLAYDIGAEGDWPRGRQSAQRDCARELREALAQESAPPAGWESIRHATLFLRRVLHERRNELLDLEDEEKPYDTAALAVIEDELQRVDHVDIVLLRRDHGLESAPPGDVCYVKPEFLRQHGGIGIDSAAPPREPPASPGAALLLDREYERREKEWPTRNRGSYEEGYLDALDEAAQMLRDAHEAPK